MSTPGLIPRHWRALAIVVAALLVGRLLLGSAGPASASTGTLIQVAPTQGTALVGQAFGGQLQVSGATGAVTYAQTTGADQVAVSPSGAVSSPASLAVGNYAVSGTDTDGNGGAGTWTFTLAVIATAPSGFTNTVVNVYQSEYSVAQQIGQSSAIQTVSAYQQQVNQLTQEQLAAMYSAVQQNPQWYQIPSLMQTVASDLPAASTTSSSNITSGGTMQPAVAGNPTGKTAATGTGSTKTATRSASALQAPTALNQVAAVQPFQPQNCPAGIPSAAVFALQIVVDVASAVFNTTLSLAVAFADAIDTQVGIGIGASVLAVVLGVAVIVHDVLAFLAQLANDCASNNLAGYVANIDNTTTETYALLTSLEAAVTQIQSTSNTTEQDVLNLQAQLTSFQTTLNQTIATDTQTIQNTVGSDTQNVTTELQTNLTGLHQDATTIENAQTTLSQVVINQTNTNTAALQSSISSALTQILNETNTDANAVTAAVTQGNQQILNTLQANFSTEQGQYRNNLYLWIEHALSLPGSEAPQIQLVLPASQGGYLNSTPVGVQSVVTNDIKAMNANGVKISSNANSLFNAANTALVNKQYVVAYQDFASCYQAFA